MPPIISIPAGRLNARRAMRARGGFTLMEMLIVGLLGTLVVTFMSNATRWYTHSMLDLHASAQLGSELKIATEAIAQDFGRSISAQTTDGSDLEFNYDTNGDSTAQWAAPDTVIQYKVQGGVLLRRDLTAGTEIAMARHITALTVTGDSTQLNANLAAGFRDITQDLNLALPNP